MFKSGIVIQNQYSLRNWARLIGHLVGQPCGLNVDGRNTVLSARSPADIPFSCRPSHLSTSNDLEIITRNLNGSLSCKIHTKNEVTQFICKRFHSGNKNENMDLAEKFRNDSEAKSFMQELLTDFEQNEPVTDEEREILQKKLGFNPTMEQNEQLVENSSQGRNVLNKNHQVSELTDLKDEDCRYVFTIDEVVDTLKEENARDVCVIQLPKKMKYVDYMVLATGRSTRHLKAMAQHFNQKYKEMKAAHHPFLTIEGKKSNDWMCIDFGNIVIHFMLVKTREIYELEKLWTLGPEFDDQSCMMNIEELRMFSPDHDLDINQESDVNEDVEDIQTNKHEDKPRGQS